jgi:hypothetical protein
MASAANVRGFVEIPLSQVPRRITLCSTWTLRTDALVDRALRFINRYATTAGRKTAVLAIYSSRLNRFVWGRSASSVKKGTARSSGFVRIVICSGDNVITSDPSETRESGKKGATMRNSRFLVLGLTAVLSVAACAWFLNDRKTGSPVLSGHSDTGRDDVLVTYKQMEKAVQTGDGNLYLSLQSQKKLNALDKQTREQFRKGFSANSSVRYEVLGSKSREDHAAVLGRIIDANGAAPYYYLVKFELENGNWKIADDRMDQDPIDASALDAAVPPKDGFFLRSRSPWNKVPYASMNTKRFKEAELAWKLQATKDESFLYLRFEAAVPLPAPDSEITGGDAKSFKGVLPAPDSMVIKMGAGKEFGLQVADNPVTRATFGENGRATSNRYFMNYSFSLRNAAHEVLFSDDTNDSFDPLIAVEDRFITVKVPLRCLGIDAADSTIEIAEANSVAKILPYQVGRFSQ